MDAEIPEIDQDEPELDAPAPVEASSTNKGSNRFKTVLYLRVMPNRTLRPVDHRSAAHYKVILELEYPTYEEELMAKKQATTFDEYHSIHYVDQDQLSEWRLRRCLVRWNMHKAIPGLTKRILRHQGVLSDDSMETIKQLPPLIRKAIISRIWEYLGTP
jgi:hypothetical protein